MLALWPINRCVSPVCSISTVQRRARVYPFCDCFNIPCLCWLDVPRISTGVPTRNGMASLPMAQNYCYALSEQRCHVLRSLQEKPMAHDVMNSKHYGWYEFHSQQPKSPWWAQKVPVKLSLKTEISSFRSDCQAQRKGNRIRWKFATPYLAAERGFIDETIEPRETKKKTHQGICHAREQSGQNAQGESMATFRCKPLTKTGRISFGCISARCTAGFWAIGCKCSKGFPCTCPATNGPGRTVCPDHHWWAMVEFNAPVRP